MNSQLPGREPAVRRRRLVRSLGAPASWLATVTPPRPQDVHC